MQCEVKKNVKMHNRIYKRYVKRSMDFILALVAIIVLCPIFLIVAILIRLKIGKPVLFKQKRPGLNEQIFTIYKFRTMTDERDEKGELLSNNLRLTKFGKLLRATSIDELPEIWNILIGDMGFVGPRPLLQEYLHYYTEEEKQRHDIRPGLTGLAQVNGRSYLSWEERFKLDNLYIANCSFILDCKIILITITKVLKRKSVVNLSEVKVDNKGEYFVHKGRTFRRLDDERRNTKCLEK